MRSAVARRVAALVLLLTLSALPAPAQAPPTDWQSPIAVDHPLVGRIWSVRDERFVGVDALRQALVEARYALLGETHDNADHHRLQAWAVAALVEAGRRPAVVFEMIDADQAPALAGYLGRPGADAAGLGAAIGWSARGWPDWALYRPIAEAALPAGLRLAAGNIGPELVQAGLRDGLAALPTERRVELALVDWRQALQDDLVAELDAAHCGAVPPERLDGLAAVQRLRDAAMADALLRADDGDGAVLIAGAGHVRRDRGVPWYLRARLAGGDIVVLVLREVRDGGADPRGYPESAHFVWFTPRADRPDRCAELRERRPQPKGG